MEEYKFSLFKVNITYDSNRKKEIYLKLIKGGKIKESIFCFWTLLYEKYMKEENNKLDVISKKVIIKQKTTNKNESNVSLSLNQNINYCAEINLIQLQKFAIENNKLERWGKGLEISNDDILFVGRKTY